MLPDTTHVVNEQRQQPLSTLDQNTMGPQSQNRLTLMARTHQMQGSSHKKRKKGGQLTLFGGNAFDPESDCEVCKGRLGGRIVHRAHHKLCPNNRRTKGMTSEETLKQIKNDEALKKHFNTPLTAEEKASSRCLSKDAGDAFFAARQPTTIAKTMKSPPPTTTTTTTTTTNTVAFCREVTAKLNQQSFVDGCSQNRAPLAMLAFASVVVEKIVRDKTRVFDFFKDLTLEVPPTQDMYDNPHYHSIVGQQLLLVDWIKTHGFEIKCPGCDVGSLVNDRTNFSKNKVLFPMFRINGPPSWCMVMSMTCGCCRRWHWANGAETLTRVPAYAAASHPVEIKHALAKSCHIGRDASQVFDELVTTCGNGDLCSRLLCNAANRAHLERVSSCCSCQNKWPGSVTQKCIADTEHLQACPPLGDAVRDACDEASSSNNTPWNTSDHDRHVREIQGVSCSRLCAEDHTRQVCKNHFRRRQLGAVALWDVATETGEIATAVTAPSTQTRHLSHAAIQLSKRDCFNPKAMHSDRWPTKTECWSKAFGANLEGHLGLFHFAQRVTTLQSTPEERNKVDKRHAGET